MVTKANGKTSPARSGHLPARGLAPSRAPQDSQLALGHLKASLVAQLVKNLPTVQETWVRSLGWEDSLEKGMATHSSILAWEIPWTEEPGGPQYLESQRVRHDLAAKQPPPWKEDFVTLNKLGSTKRRCRLQRKPDKLDPNPALLFTV